MPLTKGRELRGLSSDELKMKRESLEKGLNELRQKKITGQLDKPHQFKLMRRQIAQISTIEKEMVRRAPTALAHHQLDPERRAKRGVEG